MSISIEEYEESKEDNMGYCPECDEITRECTEPDAEGYDCPECGGKKVMGLDNALIMGYVK